MADVRLIKVFLASPGDVAREGDLVRETFDSINRALGEKEGVRFEVRNWKTDSYPAYGSDAQSLLNDQIADMSQYDLFIGIMWNRFGTPTPRADSGTEEEFLRAVESFEKTGSPWIMFYFNQAPFNPISVSDAEQKMKVLEFKGKVQGKALIYDYNGAENFQQNFRNHIESWLVKESPKKLEPPHIETESIPVKENSKQNKIAQSLSDSGMWVLLKTSFSQADAVSELSDNRVSLKIPVNDADEDAIFRSLQPGRFGAVEPIFYAHQNTAAIARISEAKRISAGGKNYWEFLLTLEENQAAYLSEFSVNGISADRIAELRARFILLNEKPQQNESNYRSNLTDGLIWAYVSRIIPIPGQVLKETCCPIYGKTQVKI
jgi:hypothetical protein